MKAKQLGKLSENHFEVKAENGQEKELLTNFLGKYAQGGKIYIVGFHENTERMVDCIGLSIDRFNEVEG